MNFLSIFYGEDDENEENGGNEKCGLEIIDETQENGHNDNDRYNHTDPLPPNDNNHNSLENEDSRITEESVLPPGPKKRQNQTNKKRKKSRNIFHEDDIDELLKLKAPKIEEMHGDDDREFSINGRNGNDVHTRDGGGNGNNNNNNNNTYPNPGYKIVSRNHQLQPNHVPSYETYPLPTSSIHLQPSSEASPQKQIETFNNLFSIDRKQLSGEYFFRGPASAYVCQEDSKKDDQIKKDFLHKIQKRTKVNEQYGKYIEEKRALKNTDISDFSNIKYNDEENIWDLSPEVSGSVDLLDKERLIMDALLEGEGHIFKYLKSSKKTLRNKYDIPILPPSYFSDFMRPARGIPFNERPCSRDERCIAYLKQLKITNTNVKDKSWIAREFLLPSDLEKIEENHNFMKTSPRKLCIYCNRNKTEEIYLRMKTKPRSLNMKDMEGKIYYEIDKDDVDEGILVIQDHIVKVSQENIKGIDAYPNDSNLLQCDPVNGLIGPFKPLIWSEYQTVTVDMVIDTQGTMGKVPALKESQFF